MSDVSTIYARWLSGELTAQEIEALKASGEWEELQSIINAVDELALPAYDKDAAYAKLKRKPNAQPKVRRLNFRTVGAIAASLLLLLGILWFLQQQTTEVSAGIAETLDYELPDKSTVKLNDGSSIIYKKSKWSDERTIELTGEAMFEVEKGQPFKVITPNGTVEVLGTSFNVRSWGSNLFVECYTGKVKVTSTSHGLILTPGKSVNTINGQMQNAQDFSHEKPLWSTGISRFYNEDINTIFEELERQFNIEVKMIDQVNNRLSGKFNHQSLEEALLQICGSAGLFYDISDDKKNVEISKKSNDKTY